MDITITAKDDSTGSAYFPYLEFSRAGIAGCIQTMRIKINERIIEEIEEYNFLSETLWSMDEVMGDANIGSIMRGRSQILVANATTDDDNTYRADALTVSVASVTFTNTYTFAVPLFSAFLGIMAKKSFPLMLFPDNSIVLELTLAPTDYCLHSFLYTNIAYTISNVLWRYDEILVPSAVGDAILQAAATGNIELIGESYRNYVTFIPAQITHIRNIIPCRVVNADTMIFLFRPLNTLSHTQPVYKLSRAAPENFLDLSTYSTGVTLHGSEVHGNFQVYFNGNMKLYSEALQHVSEYAAEIQTAFHELSRSDIGYGGEFTYSNFTSPSTTTDSGFMIVADLDRFSLNATENVGVNLSGVTLEYEMNSSQSSPTAYLSSAAGVDETIGGGLRVSTFILHHIRLHVLAGGNVAAIF